MKNSEMCEEPKDADNFTKTELQLFQMEDSEADITEPENEDNETNGDIESMPKKRPFRFNKKDPDDKKTTFENEKPVITL